MLRMLPLIVAAASLHTVDVPSVLGDRVETAKSRSGVRVLIPSSFRTEFRRLYGDVSAGTGRYELDLGAARHCGGGGACGVADFTGEVGGKLVGKRKVKLAKGFTGRFRPSTCGANCSDPQVTWKAEGVTYSVAVKFLPGKSERKAIVRVANSAIRYGPR